MREAPLCPFGRLLRQWRGLRGASQLRLATDAGISARHLSFLETGRSRPSREMVLRLAEVLDVPLRERNVLLAAAGFAALYHETALEASELEPALRVLSFLLERHEPFPAFLVDRAWRALRANQAAARAFALFAGPAAVWRESPPNLLRLALHPEGLRPHVVNWEEAAGWLVARARREAVLRRSDELGAVIDGLPALPERCRVPDPGRGFPPVLPLHLKKGAVELRVFSTLTTIDSAQDVTLQDLRIESFMPADAGSEQLLRSLEPGSGA